MEEKIIDALSDLDISETEKLLDKDLKMQIDRKTAQRIHATVFKKAGINEPKQHKTVKKLVACMATICIICITLCIAGFDNVQAVIDKVFSFIPGYGISSYSDNSINYVISKEVSAKNDYVVMTLQNVAATKNNISVFVTIMAKANPGNPQDDTEASSHLYLYDDKTKYTSAGSIMSSSNGDENVSADFDIDTKDISANKTYRFVYPAYNLSVKFTLKSVSSYSSLEEIGPTGYKNNISITAVPSLKGHKLIVDLYPINKSGYQILSFSKYYFAYKRIDLYLQTNKGKKSYTIPQFPDAMSAPERRFTFDVKDGSKDFVLKIPYVTVQSEEQRDVTIAIPQKGKTIALNQKVDFGDSTLILKDIQRQTDSDGNNTLKINVAYENRNANKVMMKASFGTIDFWGRTIERGGESTLNKNGIDIIEYIGIDKNVGSALRLRVFEPQYILLGEYSLKLNVTK